MNAAIALLALISAAEPEPANVRKPAGDAELRYWLRKHGLAPPLHAGGGGRRHRPDAEARSPPPEEVRHPPRQPAQAAPADAPLLGAALPRRPAPAHRLPATAPSGRSARPRSASSRPWDEASYVVADVPEAIWSNLGLTYLAHTHVPTVWTKQGVELEPLEWNRRADGSLDIERRLPNGIAFGAKVVPGRDGGAHGAVADQRHARRS